MSRDSLTLLPKTFELTKRNVKTEWTKRKRKEKKKKKVLQHYLNGLKRKEYRIVLFDQG